MFWTMIYMCVVLQVSVQAWTVVTVEHALILVTVSNVSVATTSLDSTALRAETKVYRVHCCLALLSFFLPHCSYAGAVFL